MKELTIEQEVYIESVEKHCESKGLTSIARNIDEHTISNDWRDLVKEVK